MSSFFNTSCDVLKSLAYYPQISISWRACDTKVLVFTVKNEKTVQRLDYCDTEKRTNTERLSSHARKPESYDTAEYRTTTENNHPPARIQNSSGPAPTEPHTLHSYQNNQNYHKNTLAVRTLTHPNTEHDQTLISSAFLYSPSAGTSRTDKNIFNQKTLKNCLISDQILHR